MRKAWKKAVSVLLTLVLIFGVLPAMNVSAEGEGGQGSGNSVEITLDNGTYNDTYKNKYGTIQYSTNYRDNSTSAEWKEISELTASDNQGSLNIPFRVRMYILKLLMHKVALIRRQFQTA